MSKKEINKQETYNKLTIVLSIRDNHKMKRELNNHLKLLKESIDWWKRESLKAEFEVEEINIEFEKGLITENQVIERLKEVSDRIDYLYRKGEYEKRNLFNVIQYH